MGAYLFVGLVIGVSVSGSRHGEEGVGIWGGQGEQLHHA